MAHVIACSSMSLAYRAKRASCIRGHEEWSVQYA